MFSSDTSIIRRSIYPGLLRGLVALLLLSGTAAAQTTDEHASHHPPATPTGNANMADGKAVGMVPGAGTTSVAPGMVQPAAVPAKSSSTPAGGGMDAGMGMGMGDDMGMGGAPRRELYPSMMRLTTLTPENRIELERAARDRIASGRSSILSGVDHFRSASRKQDLAGLKASAVQMREGVSTLESGVAALAAIAEGHAPNAIALDWFQSNMGLLPAQDMVAPHGLFGLSWFHYFLMLLLLALAASMIWMNIRKMQRANALAARLAPLQRAAGSEPATTEVAAPAQTPQEPTLAPSKPNSWTGLLRVERIFEEAPNVRTLRLVDPAHEDLPFRYLPGQFITFTVRPNDKPVKRSYTISSSPTRLGLCEVTVKREPRGTVSGFLHDMHVGDTIQVTGPSGNFTFVGETANSVVLISGGVGITPMMSVVRYLSDRSWRGEIFFIYACRSEQDFIYREELEYLQKRQPNLHLTITASEPTSDAWPYDHGFVTRELLLGAIPYITTRHVHLCGPKPMMDAVKRLLSELEVPDAQIATEVFVGKERTESVGAPIAPASTGSPAQEAVPGTGVAVAKFVRSGLTAMLPADKTVLEASEDVGVNIDYSCRVGTCGVCKIKLLEGAVTMDVEDALDDQDRRNGIILACQAKATADVSVDA